MSFLFKNKKTQPVGTAIPQTTRAISSRDGQSNGTVSSGPYPTEQGSLFSPGSAPRVGSTNARSAPSPTPDSKQLMGRGPGTELPIKHTPRIPQTRPPPDASLYPWSNRRLSFMTGFNPFPRYGASVNGASSKEGEIYMMGGLIDGTTVKGDLWILEAGSQPTKCYEVETTSEGPGPRVGHASLLVGNAFIVFGGDTKIDEHDVLDDTLYLLNTSTKDWSRAAPGGPRPAGRYGHTLNIIGSKIYVFGGQVEGYFFNDLLAFDLNALQGINSRWEILVQNTLDGGPPQGQSPPARTNHTVITYDDKLYLFGGTDGQHWFNDVWTYDPRINAWIQQDCIGYIPAAREGHAAAIVADVMYVFGGRTEEGKDLGDVAGFRISTRRWYTFQNMGPSPSPRSGHGMTAFNNQIFVFGGEPSSAPRNLIELSEAYVLDTGKIRYPEEKPGSKSGNLRRPSVTDRSGTPQQERSTSRDGSVSSNLGGRTLNAKTSQDSIASNTGNYSRPLEINAGYLTNGQPPKGSRSAPSPVPSGPPPSQALPQPRTNGTRTPVQNSFEGRESSRLTSKADRTITNSQPSRDNATGTNYNQTRDVNTGVRIIDPAPDQTLQEDASSPAVNFSQQHQQQSSQGSNNRRMTETPDTAARAGEDLIQTSFKHSTYADSGVGSSPALSTQQHPDWVAKELESARSKNAWYASELALARKAGYRSSATESPSSLADDKTVEAFGDEEKPLLEALLRMRAELVKVQDSLTSQSSAAAERVAQVEREKQAAISEVMFLRTHQASHEASSDQTYGSDAGMSGRSEEASRRLATALYAQNELQLQIQSLSQSFEAERTARKIAEESANAAHSRASDLDAHKQRSVSEIESLRAELHDAERLARECAITSGEATSSAKMLQLDKEEISYKLTAAQEDQRNHVNILSTLRAAVTASTEKASLLERQLDQERHQRAGAEEKLLQLRSEYETRVSEFDSITRKLRSSEDLIAHHAAEASTHREALLAGLEKSNERAVDAPFIVDERISIMQQSLDEAKNTAQRHRDAADHASNRLRSAEERIAGLEAYQEQSSREGLSLRKQLQIASRDGVTLQTEYTELQRQLNENKLELGAAQMELLALKGILSDRGINTSQLSKGIGEPHLNANNARRLQQLEEELETTTRSQEEMRQTYEKREQDLRKTRDAEYRSLENECQQMREYIEGFHDVAEKLKKNIKKEKAENQSLREELEHEKQSATSTAMADFETERATFRQMIENLQHRVDVSETETKQQMQQILSANAQRDAYKDESIRYRHELDAAISQSRGGVEIEHLRQQNAELETRAAEAEKRAQLLLDTVGTSVSNYRRQSQSVPQVNGLSAGHTRGLSTASAGGASVYSTHSINNGPIDTNPDRNSAVFDSFVMELDNLRNQWETTSKTYTNRMSDRSIMGTTASADVEEGTSTSNSMADWRRRLEFDDDYGGVETHSKA